MNIAILQFPGSNCERETMLAVKRAGMHPIEVLWNEPVEKWQTCDGFIIVGGFSYEDRSRAGIIAALDPIIPLLKTQNEQGKPILGICNGAQILVEAGLVPGFEQYAVHMALSDNQRIQQDHVVGTGYYNAWIHLKAPNTHQKNAFTRYLNKSATLSVPIAHAEGRFVIPPNILDIIETNGLITLQYCTAQGEIINEFPTNPNGSIQNIAALTNPAGNVLAMMPHPERTPMGDPIFSAMRDYIASPYSKPTNTFLKDDGDHAIHINTYAQSPSTQVLIIESIITDNHALSVENTLRKIGIQVTIKRQIHWEVASPSQVTMQTICASYILYNNRKEFIARHPTKKPNQQTLLIRAKEDIVGRDALQQLKQQTNHQDIHQIKYGILWQIKADPNHLNQIIDQVIKTGILFNPASHECFYYG